MIADGEELSNVNPFDKDVVVSPPSVLHADHGVGIEEELSEIGACEVASLIGVHNLMNCSF